MKCKDCTACKKGWFESSPDEYVCIGVKHPFTIENINNDCIPYGEREELLKTLNGSSEEE